MTFPTKNGLPWTSVYKLPDPVDPVKLSILKECWEEENWGKNFENNRREPIQAAIYPCTRRVGYNPTEPFGNKKLEKVIVDLSEDLKKLFPVPMSLLWAELTLLVPNGIVEWHHDRMKTGSFATRVMIPFTENKGIKYYFCSWNKNTPINNDNFPARHFLSDDVYEVEMSPGHYYTFNHRVPHKTASTSPEPRGMLMVEMMPDEHYFQGINFGPITEFEKTPILPPQI